jgi:anthranilate 1,2-dioxygenase small subunit
MNDTQEAAAHDPRLDALFLRHELEMFNAAYAAALDEQRLSDWVEMWTCPGLVER